MADRGRTARTWADHKIDSCELGAWGVAATKECQRTDRRNAGSAIGAVFIKRFIKDARWAHLDIAGVAWSKKDKPTVPKGATAFGVRLLDRFVSDNFE